jgi:hypothetical protein
VLTPPHMFGAPMIMVEACSCRSCSCLDDCCDAVIRPLTERFRTRVPALRRLRPAGGYCGSTGNGAAFWCPGHSMILVGARAPKAAREARIVCR